MSRLSLLGLTPGTNYKIQFRAVEGDQVSEWSRRFDLATSTDITPPDVPAWAVSNDWVVNGDTFIATWQPLNFTLDQNIDFDHYEIEFDDTVSQTVIHTNNISETLDFEHNRSYFGTPKATVKARVRSVDAVGNASAWSAQKTATNPAPSAPASITVTSLYDSVKVNWATVSDIDLIGYKVQVSTTSSSSGFSDIYNGPDNVFIHNTIMFVTDHWFRVYAVDKFGSLSTATTSGSVRPKTSFAIDGVPPATPATLTATGGFDTTNQQSYFDLSWASVADSDLDVYIIRYGTNGANWEYITVPRENTTYRLSVDPSKSYYIAVTARDLSGNLQTTYRNASVYPVTSTADTSAPSQPAAPTVASNTLQAQIIVSGNKQAGGAMEPDVSFYEVYAGTGAGFTANNASMLGQIAVGPAMVSTFDIPASGASGSNQTWYFKIIAVDRAGNKSSASPEATSSVNLIGTTNIGDLVVTNAKINDLTANKITAGTGFINNLIVKSTFTLGDASTDGIIQSYDYVAATTGFKLQKNALEINSGTIRASALALQIGNNLMPPLYADFEAPASAYPANLSTGSLTTSAFTSAQVKFNTQSLLITSTAGAARTWYLGSSSTDYNIPLQPSTRYIVSGYLYNASGASVNGYFGIKQQDATTVNGVLTSYANTASWVRYQNVITTTSSATSGVLAFTSNANCTFYLDGIQIEQSLNATNTTPSAWSPPGSTTINGALIKTGAIQSTALALDVNGATIAGIPAWKIDTTGAAVFGDALIRGRLIMGITGDYENSISPTYEADGTTIKAYYEDTSKLAGIGSIQSYNYSPGAAGWAIRSNGFAEFLQLKANSISGDVISALSPDKLKPGIMTADLIIGTNIRSVESGTLYVISKARTSNVATLTLSTSHTRLVGDQIQVKLDQSVAVDTSFDTSGGIFATVTAITDTTISYSNTGSNVTNTAHAGDSYIYIEGRSVTMSPSGVTLFNNDGISRVVDFPTDPLSSAYFAGNVDANSLNVRDNFLLQGVSNALAAGGILTLNASVVAPSSYPTLSFSYEQAQTWMDNTFSSWKSGLWYDASAYITTNAFFGGQAFGSAASGAFLFNKAIDDDAGGDGYSPYGVVKISGKFYVLINDQTDGLWKVRRFATTGTGFDTLESTLFTYDRHTTMGCTTTEWIIDGFNGSALNDPIIGTDGTDIYIARCAKNGKIWVAKYNVSGVFQSEVTTNITDNQNLKGLNIGTFDFASTRYVISTEGNASKVAKNYVTNASGAHQTTETWDTPGGRKLWGLCHDGTQFVALTQTNRLYFHTSVAQTGTNVWYSKAAWYDGANSRTVNISAVSGNGTTTTVTTSIAHGYVAGDIIYIASSLGAALNAIYHTIVTAPTTTTFTIASVYSGSAGAGGTVTNEWETSLSVPVTSTITRRAKLTITAGTIPAGAGSNVPDRARFYFSNVSGGAGSYYRQDNTNASSQQTFTSNPLFSGSTGPLTAFPAGTAALLQSNNGKMNITADGFALFGATSNANASAGNLPPLRVGSPTGTHLRIDGDSVQRMISDSSANILNLNPYGGAIRLGESSTIFSKIKMGVADVSSNASAITTTAHGLAAVPDIVLIQPKNVGVARVGRWDVGASDSTNFQLLWNKASDGTILTSAAVNFVWMAIKF